MQDIAVIGGGIVGLLAARALAARGYRVDVLDAPHSRPGASWAGGGILAPLFPWRYPSAITELCRGAVDEYQAVADEIRAAGGPDPQIRSTGMVVFAPDERDGALAWARHENIRLDAVNAGSLHPGLPDTTALWLPDTGVVRNPRFLDGLRRLLGSRYATLPRSEAVTRMEPVAGGWRLSTASGAVSARQVLVAAGVWSRSLLAPLGLELPLMPVKGEMLRYPPVSNPPDRILLSRQGYLIPRADGSVLAGSTVREGDEDMRPTEGAARSLQQAAQALWPPLRDCAPVAQWAGVRPGTERPAPLISALPGHEGLYVAAGHYRNGLAAAPGTARQIAALMCGETPPLDPAPYDWDPASVS